MCITLSFAFPSLLRKDLSNDVSFAILFEKFYVFEVCFSRYFRNFSIIFDFVFPKGYFSEYSCSFLFLKVY